MPRGTGSAPVAAKIKPPTPSPSSGKSPAAGTKSKTVAAANENFLMTSLSEQDCQRFIATTLQPRIRKVGGDVFYLARTAKVASVDRTSKFSYELKVVRLSHSGDLRQDKLFEFQGPANVGLLVHESPVVGFSILSFEGTRSDCLAGSAVGVSIAYEFGAAKQLPPMRSINLGPYGLVDGYFGRFLLDLQRPLIKTVNPKSGQIDVAYQFERDEIPLFFDQQKRTAVFWKLLPQPHITRRGSVHSIEIGQLNLKVGERLVQNEDQFAVMRSTDATHSLEIDVQPGWAAVASKATYSLGIPTSLELANARVRLDFAEKLVAVFSLKENMPLYLIRIGRGLLTQRGLTTGQKIVGVEILNNGKYLLIFTENARTGMETGVQQFDVANETWTPVNR